MKKKALTQIAFEFLSIVFAVLLALGLNSFKQNMDAKAEAEKIMSSILNEIELNLGRADTTLIKNQDYANYLDSLVQLEPEDVTSFYFAYEFELLTSSAWVLSQNNKITNNLDESFLMDASSIYQTQDFYQKFSEKMFQSIGEMLSQQDKLNQANMALSMYYNIGVMNSVAEDLMMQQRAFLKKYAQPDSNED